MKQKNISALMSALIVMSLLLLLIFATACTPKAATTDSGMPTGDAAVVDNDLDQDQVDSEVINLEEDLKDW